MFTQNRKINTCHIFVLLHKSIFLTFVCKTDVQIKTFATTDRRSFGRDARCSQWLPGGVSPAATTSALVEGKKISRWEGTRPPGDPLSRSWCSVPKGFQGKCGSQDTRPCFSPAKDCWTLGHCWWRQRGQSRVQACYWEQSPSAPCLCQSRGGEAQADVATGWSAAAAEVCWIQQASYSKN